MRTGCREHSEWLRQTLEIAERCNVQFPFGKPQFPAFIPPDNVTAKEFLYRLVLRGLRERYGGGAKLHEPQVMEELGIIADVGYEDYFLITWDMLQECRRRGIEWITRGSAADSLVCYCLGISGVCPIRFDLYFRRFLNKDRMALHKLPDIDIDFAHDRKDDVVKIIFEKFGQEHCAVVGGFSSFQARSAFAEVAKVLGVSEREVRKFTDRFPWGHGGGWVPDEPNPTGGARLMELLQASPENRDLPMGDEPYKTALETAVFLDGMPRYPKMHPCGVVLSRQAMHELTPTFIANTRQFWIAQSLLRTFGTSNGSGQSWLIPPADPNNLPQIPVAEPGRHERLRWETELFGFAVSSHPLELFKEIAWDTYCPVNRLKEFVGEIVHVCGLVVEQRVHHQVSGEPMKFLSLADWTGIIETELFAQTYKNYALATVRYPVLEVEAKVEAFENGRGFNLRVLSAGKPRTILN